MIRLNGKLATIALAALVGGLLGGCATQPIPTSNAAPVPKERVIDSAFLQNAPSTAQVIIKRDTGMKGSGCATRLFVNAKPVADIRPGEKVGIYLPEGEYILSVYPNDPCGGGLVETKATVKLGGSYIYRIGSMSNAGIGIYPTAF
ncbi:MAG TPA: hypothetical protein VK149_09515 [Sideroxyarcus sp.]|nr:hypothetical protein [Sideroxyarcus sp.]